MTGEKVKSAAKQLDSWESTPIVNAVNELSHDDGKELQQLMLRLHGLDARTYRPGTCVDQLKNLLGKQTYCWTGEYRYWVWEIDGHVRIFANATQGISFEVRADLSAKERLAELKKFISIWRAD